MKNKNIKYTFWNKKLMLVASLATAISVSSCDKDLLDTVPKTQVLTNNMWLTDNLTDQGVTGVYQNLRNGQMLYEYDTYVTLQGRDNSVLMNGTATASSGIFSSEWQNLYEGIHRANDAVYGLTNISPTEEVKKSRLLAEVKFLRAFYYYRLNQLYQGVPIYTEPIEWNKVDKPRNTEDEVWNLIVQDLTDCINETNLPNRYEATNSNFGRISKSAAYALRGKVYMYRKEWQKAIDDFQKVKDLGHTLFGNYENLFKGENEKSPEIIFSIQNIALPGYGSNYQFRFGSRSAFGSNWNTFLVHPDAVDRYQKKDGSPFNWNDYIPGYNAMDPVKREVFFLRNNLTATEIANMTKKGLDMSLYLPTSNEQRVMAAYVDRDPRLSSNVILPYSTFVGANGATDQVFTSRWPYRQEFGGVFDLRTDIVPNFYYYPRKFVYTGANPGIPNREAGAYDYIVIRYADILLLWAEALNELHKSGEAVIKANEVRTRASVQPIRLGIGEDDLRKEIRDERRRELMCEGVIYFDELRWKTLKATSFYAGNGIKEVWGRVNSPYTWGGDHLFTWPVPQLERERNTNLTQNPGWDN
ncbi:RagB/SusD family nutrient uptake outer membrane protein [Sphingobacterium faecium]|jgi:tetratricopeptide (TPR) repeat protein|uniref:RagB/SusD family nutrient uptake outer membrane protein n=1 Tax=Sphingobacterium faecium TaxID=34087 RepID=UPI000B9B28E9|nr:RagB/SusD family nutrient uptake outer membrane protein [Sphingobacterium faecium]WGQ16520.1 RagB/SusD family nutrient uptake outer membrane protein [Sphingobacterium faecium]HCU45469.1 RagB/SusD family nutrient uptake outer membrane protein [Sphingobacterium sp.]